MNTARKTEHDLIADCLLHIIYGGQHKSNQKGKRVNDFWALCHSMFWSTENFSTEQEEHFKKLIAAHFAGCVDVNEKFKELVQRAVLAKRYIKRRSGRYITRPMDWLNINFKLGLTGTHKWYEELELHRDLVTFYDDGLAVLARAILAFSQKRSAVEFSAYRNELIKHKQPDLLWIYTNAVMHIQFINQ